MPIRISGINSGLDTEGLVTALVSAYSVKKQKYDKQLQKQEWSMNKWSEVNTKVYGFYTSTLSSLRFSSGYNLKTSTVSRTGVADVKASSGAVTSTQTLSVSQLATSGYMTGGKVTGADGKLAKSDAKLSELGISDGTIMVGDKKIEVSGDMSIDKLMSKFKENGVDANYDANNGRIYVSSKTSGADNEFTVTAGDTNGLNALKTLGLMSVTDIDGKETSEMAKYRKLAASGYDSDSVVNSKYEASKWTVDSYKAKLTSTVSAATKNKESLEKKQDALNEKLDKLKASDYDWSKDYKSEDDYNKAVDDINTQLTDNAASIADYQKTIDDNQAILDSESALSAKVDELNAEMLTKFKADASAEVAIAKEIVSQFDAGTLSNSADSARITAKDAKITLNGASYTSNTNSFAINGLSINVSAVTTTETVDADGNKIVKDDPITISTATDTQGVYDKVKELLTKYNELSSYLNNLYYADSASGYEPLTDEEKETMTDKQIEQWEDKIKTSLLRKDSTIGNLSSAMKTAILGTSIEYKGHKYDISSFGISSESYFSASNETRGSFHINGDKSDPLTSGNQDKLMAAISENPEAVVNFFQKLADNLYNEIGKKMSASTISSAFTIYNDKEMSSQYSDYKDKVKEWETKLSDYEDYYYKKFSAMETALAKLQSQQSQLAGLLGNG